MKPSLNEKERNNKCRSVRIDTIIMWDVMCKDVVGCRSDRAKVRSQSCVIKVPKLSKQGTGSR